MFAFTNIIVVIIVIIILTSYSNDRYSCYQAHVCDMRTVNNHAKQGAKARFAQWRFSLLFLRPKAGSSKKIQRSDGFPGLDCTLETERVISSDAICCLGNFASWEVEVPGVPLGRCGLPSPLYWVLMPVSGVFHSWTDRKPLEGAHLWPWSPGKWFWW